MKLVKEEIFGPVVCAQPFSDENLEKIAETANNTNFGLAASVWTKDISTAHKLAAKIRSELYGLIVITYLMPHFHLEDIKNQDGEEKWVMKF